jgi:hypothetical protein
VPRNAITSPIAPDRQADCQRRESREPLLTGCTGFAITETHPGRYLARFRRKLKSHSELGFSNFFGKSRRERVHRPCGSRRRVRYLNRQVNGLLMSPLLRKPGPFRRVLPVHLSAVPEVAGCIPDPELSPSPTPIPTIRRGGRAAPIPGYPPGRYRPSGHSHPRPTTPRAAPCPPPAAPASARDRRANASSIIARPRPDRPARPAGDCARCTEVRSRDAHLPVF